MVHAVTINVAFFGKNNHILIFKFKQINWFSSNRFQTDRTVSSSHITVFLANDEHNIALS